MTQEETKMRERSPSRSLDFSYETWPIFYIVPEVTNQLLTWKFYSTEFQIYEHFRDSLRVASRVNSIFDVNARAIRIHSILDFRRKLSLLMRYWLYAALCCDPRIIFIPLTVLDWSNDLLHFCLNWTEVVKIKVWNCSALVAKRLGCIIKNASSIVLSSQTSFQRVPCDTFFLQVKSFTWTLSHR